MPEPSGPQLIEGLINGIFRYLKLDSYQRRNSWKPKLKASLIRSIIYDWPSGILILNKNTPSNQTSGGDLSYDIIDGQQRLSTLWEFMKNPLIYVNEWAPEPIEEDEPEELHDLREQFNEIANQWSRGPPRSRIAEAKKAVSDNVGLALESRIRGSTIQIPDIIRPLADSVYRIYSLVGNRSIHIQILTDISTTYAEKMFLAINTQSEPIGWWELKRAGEYNKKFYKGDSSYNVRYLTLIRDLSESYHSHTRVSRRQRQSQQPTLWDALYAIGEYYHLLFESHSTNHILNNAARLSSSNNRLLIVDGLGFRLVSGLLAHEISLTKMNTLIDEYSEITISKAIDCLFDTAKELFCNSGKYQLFSKYARFGVSVMPSYPLMCLIIASAHMVGRNSTTQTLTDHDKASLRILTEQLLRESLTSDKWSGHGDSELKLWLNVSFIGTRVDYVRNDQGDYVLVQYSPQTTNPPLFPGTVNSNITAPSNHHQDWSSFIDRIEAGNTRSVPKQWQFFWFLNQYIVDSRINNGSLPKKPVQFDHIVPYNRDNPDTRNPFNFCAITKELNSASKKGGKSYQEWNPEIVDKAEYDRYSLNNQSINLGSNDILPVNFLSNADSIGLSQMIAFRKDQIRQILNDGLRYWISEGDQQ